MRPFSRSRHHSCGDSGLNVLKGECAGNKSRVLLEEVSPVGLGNNLSEGIGTLGRNFERWAASGGLTAS